MTLRHHITNWSLGITACFAILLLNAYLDHKHSETDALQRSADISSDRAAEFAAINNKAAEVAMKEQ